MEQTSMPTNVVMPQMGESIAEGTVVRWIKKVGDNVDRDEPLFEISTDKVDAEIPSPGAGVLTEIKVKEGETVPVNSVVAVIGGISASTAAGSEPAAVATVPKGESTTGLPEAVVGQPEVPAATATAAVGDATGATAEASSDDGDVSLDEVRRQRSSPLVPR